MNTQVGWQKARKGCTKLYEVYQHQISEVFIKLKTKGSKITFKKY
jgi:hypothetical protein